MPDPETNEFLAVLLSLLPGLVTVEIIRALTVRAKQEPLERIIQALLFTLLDHTSWAIVTAILTVSDRWNLVGLFLLAIVWGLFFTYCINSGKVYNLLRRINLTKQTPRPSVWYETFYDKEEYAVFHLKDGHRVFGWPLLYPNDPAEGHFLLTDAEWLDDESKDKQRPRLSILLDASEVRFVEFIPLIPRKETDHAG